MALHCCVPDEPPLPVLPPLPPVPETQAPWTH